MAINFGKTTVETSNRSEKGKSLLEFPTEYTVIDIETTGLSPQYDSIIELSALKIENTNIVGTFSELVNPGFRIDSFITELTGITNEMLKDAKKIEQVLPEFIEFIGSSHLIGHNVNFDINFIYDNCVSVLGKPLKNNFTDTMRISRRIVKELSHHRLSDLASHYNVSYEGAHRALNDCKITNACYIKLQEDILKKYGTLEAFVNETLKKNYSASYKISEIVSNKDNFDVSHPLFGKYCVFTGTLEKMVRKDAMQIVVDCGGFVESSVTAKTNFLILGNNDYCSTIKDGKSTKQKKAEQLKLSGSEIEIIPEAVFYDLISDGINENDYTEEKNDNKTIQEEIPSAAKNVENKSLEDIFADVKNQNVEKQNRIVKFMKNELKFKKEISEGFTDTFSFYEQINNCLEKMKSENLITVEESDKKLKEWIKLKDYSGALDLFIDRIDAKSRKLKAPPTWYYNCDKALKLKIEKQVLAELEK